MSRPRNFMWFTFLIFALLAGCEWGVTQVKDSHTTWPVGLGSIAPGCGPKSQSAKSLISPGLQPLAHSQEDIMIDVHNDLRILVNGWDSGIGLLYDKADGIWKPISRAKVRYLLSEYHQATTDSRLRLAEIEQVYGDLYIEQTDVGLERCLVARDRQLIRFDELERIVKAGEDPQINRAWIGDASEVKDSIPTRMMKARYIFQKDRQDTVITWNDEIHVIPADGPHMASAITYWYATKWLPHEEDRRAWELSLAKGFERIKATKNICIKAGLSRNSGKTVGSALDMLVFGSYVVQLKLVRHLSEGFEEEYLKFMYRNQTAAFVTFAETLRNFHMSVEMAKISTGRDLMLPVYKTVAQVPWSIKSQLLGVGSNEPLANTHELEDRVFYIPAGATIPIKQRDLNFQALLETELQLDLRLSYLVDKYMPHGTTTPLVKSSRMKMVDTYADILNNPVGLFLRMACLVGISEAATKVQRHTCTEIERLFNIFIRNLWVHILRTLEWDRDDQGNLKPDSELLILLQIPTERDFRKLMNSRIGTAITADRLNRGYSWPNLVVKSPAILWASNPKLLSRLDFYTQWYEVLDKVKTVEHSQAFLHDFQILSQSTVVAMATGGMSALQWSFQKWIESTSN